MHPNAFIQFYEYIKIKFSVTCVSQIYLLVNNTCNITHFSNYNNLKKKDILSIYI